MMKRILIGVVMAVVAAVIRQQMSYPGMPRSMPDMSAAFSQMVGSSKQNIPASTGVQQNPSVGENLTTVIVGNKKFIVPKASPSDGVPPSANAQDHRGSVKGRSDQDASGSGRAATVSLTGHDPQQSRCERLRLIDRCTSTVEDPNTRVALLKERSDCIARGYLR
jgi:hypothetical protein